MRTAKLKFITVFSLLTLCLPVSFVAQENGNDGKYILKQNTPNPFSDVTTIKFSLKETCYVKLYVTEQQSGKNTLLVDGEMSAGEHGIIFKAAGRNGSGSENHFDYTGNLEAYSLTGNMLLHSSEIKMLQR